MSTAIESAESLIAQGTRIMAVRHTSGQIRDVGAALADASLEWELGTTYETSEQHRETPQTCKRRFQRII